MRAGVHDVPCRINDITPHIPPSKKDHLVTLCDLVSLYSRLISFSVYDKGDFVEKCKSDDDGGLASAEREL